MGDLGPWAALLDGGEQLGKQPQRVGAKNEEITLSYPLHARSIVWHVLDGFSEVMPL